LDFETSSDEAERVMHDQSKDGLHGYTPLKQSLHAVKG